MASCTRSSFAAAGLFLAALAACGKSSSSSSSSPPQSGTPVNAGDRIGWDQNVIPGTELSDFSYAMYVDGAKVALTDVSCADTPGDQGYACTAAMPALTAGAHNLQLVAVRQADTQLESDKSDTLNVYAASALPGSVT